MFFRNNLAPFTITGLLDQNLRKEPAGKDLKSSPAVAQLVLFPQGLLEVHLIRSTCADAADGIAHGAIASLHALLGLAIVGGALAADADAFGSFDGVDIGSKEDKLPSIALLLALDHILDTSRRIVVAVVFHTVGGDEKDGMLGHILGAGVFVDVAYVVDRPAYGIEQRGTALHLIVLARHRLDIADVHTVVDDLARILLLYFLFCSLVFPINDSAKLLDVGIAQLDKLLVGDHSARCADQ